MGYSTPSYMECIRLNLTFFQCLRDKIMNMIFWLETEQRIRVGGGGEIVRYRYLLSTYYVLYSHYRI